MRLRLAGNILLGIVLLCLYAASYSALLAHRAKDADATRWSSSGIWDLPPVVLRIIAGEFKGLMADYLTLEAGARLGTEIERAPEGGYQVVEEEIDWPTVARILAASQVLDPSFAQTYILAQGTLPWEGMINETQQMLQTAVENRPWDWQPGHFLGFNTYYFLEKPGEAGKTLLEAAKRPKAPPFLSILGARLAQRGGETEAAIALMRSMLIDKPKTDLGYADIVDRLHALEGVLVIERAVQRYEETYGNKPESLDELVSSGILVAPPENPYHLHYCLDKTGTIVFDALKCPQ